MTRWRRRVVVVNIKKCSGCGRDMPELIVPALLPEVYGLGKQTRVLWVVRSHHGEKVNCNNKKEALAFFTDEMALHIKDVKLYAKYKAN
jgi:hypothetical protein